MAGRLFVMQFLPPSRAIAHFGSANCPAAYQGLKIITSLALRFPDFQRVIEKIGDFDTIKQMLIDISRDKLSQNLLDREQDKTPFQLNKNDAGSRYFCESLFWASQPKQAAKT